MLRSPRGCSTREISLVGIAREPAKGKVVGIRYIGTDGEPFLWGDQSGRPTGRKLCPFCGGQMSKCKKRYKLKLERTEQKLKLLILRRIWKCWCLVISAKQTEIDKNKFSAGKVFIPYLENFKEKIKKEHPHHIMIKAIGKLLHTAIKDSKHSKEHKQKYKLPNGKYKCPMCEKEDKKMGEMHNAHCDERMNDIVKKVVNTHPNDSFLEIYKKAIQYHIDNVLLIMVCGKCNSKFEH